MFALAADVSLRIVAAAAAVGLVLVVLRVRSGAARHAAWSAVLVAMLTMPVLMVIVPPVAVPVPSALALNFDTIGGEPNPYAPPETRMNPIFAERQSSVAPTSRALEAKASPPWRPTFRSGYQIAVVALYVAGALFFFVRIAAGWILARRLVARAIRVECDNRAPVFESPAVATPMTTGIGSPCVLLPVTWREWPEDKLRAVLAHENAHIVRRDSLVALLAQANRAIFWFHPLAWWLERTLAVTAEHACDETAARQVGQPRRYAEVLLDMADAVRLRGHRVSWQTIGVDGSGLLSTRIDRLLKGDALARMSRVQRVAVAVGCAAVLVLAIACRQQIAAAPLRPDPEVQKQIDDNKAREERHRAALAMTVAEAAALERTLEASPDNVEAREKLIIFYDQAGKATWEEKLAGIRKHTLWRIAHLPATNLWIPHISKRYDPEGYAEAKRLWLEQTSNPGVTARTLGRAAAFLGTYDKPVAEELLIRAQRMEPEGPWSDRLGDLYAHAIVGSVDPRYGALDASEAQSAFAAEARRKLEATSDPKLLAAAGRTLMRWSATAVSADGLARRYLERAATLDPQHGWARNALDDERHYERRRAIRSRLEAAGARDKFDEFSDATYAAISALPAEDRLFYLPGAAEGAYMRAEYIDYTAREKPEAEQAQARTRAAQGFARARQYAADALALAPNHQQTAQDNDVIYRAETVLGVLALKDGDRKAAVAHMRTAGAAPISDAGRNTSRFGLRARLAEYLLRAGERASVAEYLEKSAERTLSERDRLLKDAERIRAGVMPLSYQYAEARR
jgi:beta-lactamase regulating signal transducer with metallopeptidase domain